jgi:glycosyltransferase involved in cell wall biosynthesis
MPEVCLVIPCYNEARRLPVEAVLSFVAAHRDCSVCFVNDGSSDSTRHTLEALRARAPERVLVLDLERNGGKAEAVRRGVLHVAAGQRYEMIGYWDADLSTPLEQVQAMRDTLEQHQASVLAMGSRWRRLGSSIERSARRHMLGRVFATAASLVLDLPVYDSQCGAKLFRASATDVLFKEPFTTTWLFDLELLARLRNHLGLAEVQRAVFEVPLTEWREVGGSKLGLAAMMAAPVDLFRIHRRYNAK